MVLRHQHSNGWAIFSTKYRPTHIVEGKESRETPQSLGNPRCF